MDINVKNVSCDLNLIDFAIITISVLTVEVHKLCAPWLSRWTEGVKNIVKEMLFIIFNV